MKLIRKSYHKLMIYSIPKIMIIIDNILNKNTLLDSIDVHTEYKKYIFKDYIIIYK